MASGFYVRIMVLTRECNMSSAGYCVSSNAALLAAHEAAKAVDPLAEVVSFIDDTYFIGLPQAAAAGRQVYQRKLEEDLQVRENQTKRKCLLGAGVNVADLPQELSWCVVPSLDIVGAEMDCARVDRIPTRRSLQANAGGRGGPSCEKTLPSPPAMAMTGGTWHSMLVLMKCTQSSSF